VLASGEGWNLIVGHSAVKGSLTLTTFTTISMRTLVSDFKYNQTVVMLCYIVMIFMLNAVKMNVIALSV